MRMIAHRIADPRILRLIRLWLRAGVMEDGVYADTVEGTPQGAGISPLLANIYLHYALDLWVAQWRRREARRHVRLVRYADDYLLLFEDRADALRMLVALPDRLAKFGLSLHEGKTRLVEFGRFAAANRHRRGAGRPETFDFLGFTHFCGVTRKGGFMVQRKTQGDCAEFRVWVGHERDEGAQPCRDAKNHVFLMRSWTNSWPGRIPRRPLIQTAFSTI